MVHFQQLMSTLMGYTTAGPIHVMHEHVASLPHTRHRATDDHRHLGCAHFCGCGWEEKGGGCCGCEVGGRGGGGGGGRWI